MDKQQLLSELRQLILANQVSKEEVLSVFDETSPQQGFKRHIGVADILYYLGGAIVFIGISILVAQNWESLNGISRILVTLGSSVAAFVMAVLFDRSGKMDQVSVAFYLISALLLPMGILVTFSEAGVNPESSAYQAIAAAISLGVYLTSYFLFKKEVFNVFNVIFGTWLFYSLTTLLVGPTPYFDSSDYFFYRSMVVGATYLTLGYYFATMNRPLAGPLYAFGSFAFLGSTLALQGYSPDANAFWEIIYPGIVFGMIFLSVYLKSKALLSFGSLFLMIYILKITAEYFSQGLGWPASLVIAGLALIGVGYYTVRLKQRYIN
ncbi:MAG TPA: DUF2157 domain-containing protein [Verrucomicrobiae bacterium]|nr:DUF2157 domain-containing protein [Verrucomicrobiae bacterium]